MQQQRPPQPENNDTDSSSSSSTGSNSNSAQTSPYLSQQPSNSVQPIQTPTVTPFNQSHNANFPHLNNQATAFQQPQQLQIQTRQQPQPQQQQRHPNPATQPTSASHHLTHPFQHHHIHPLSSSSSNIINNNNSTASNNTILNNNNHIHNPHQPHHYHSHITHHHLAPHNHTHHTHSHSHSHHMQRQYWRRTNNKSSSNNNHATSSGSIINNSNVTNAINHRRPNHVTTLTSRSTNSNIYASSSSGDGAPHSLLDLSAKIVAEYIPFQSIEQKYERIPEPVQKRIIFWSFPRHEDDIRMYSSLANDTFTTNGPSSTNVSPTSNSTTNTTTNQLPSNNAAQQHTASSNSSSSSNAWGVVDQLPHQHHPRHHLPAAAAVAAVAAAAAAQAVNPPVGSLDSNPATSSSSSHSKNAQQKQLTFHKGLRLYNEGCVHEVLQIGFNLSGAVVVKSCSTNQPSPPGLKVRGTNHLNGMVASLNQNNNEQNHNINNSSSNNINNNNNNNNNINHLHYQAQGSNSNNDPSTSSLLDQSTKKSFRVSVTFDRCKITSVSCSCELQDIFWCEHAVALILYRIRNPETIDLRVPISETLLSLDRQQLQKLVQYIIAEHHTEVLPTAQRLLDEMRQSFSEINQIQGAPDPTAGACADDELIWHLDEQQVNEKVQTYLNLVCSNSKDAHKQINALFEKIREMFRAKDSNSTRMLKLITEQFLYNATRNEKSRPLWDQLISLWVVVMLNPDISRGDRAHFVQLLSGWSRVIRCPKEDVERRVSLKRKAAELSDDEEADEATLGRLGGDLFPPTASSSSSPSTSLSSSSLNNGGNNYPAHMATHRHRAFQNCNNNTLPVLRPYNQLSVFQPSTCLCQSMHSMTKKMRSSGMPSANDCHNRNYRIGSTSNGAHGSSHNLASSSGINENRPLLPQEPRSVFHRALDYQDVTWDDAHLQLILNKDGPIEYDLGKAHPLDYSGNPLWNEPISHAAARVETLRSHGYRDQALRLAVATIRCLKLYQDQWCLKMSPNTESDLNITSFIDIEAYSEPWIGHPFDPINILLDLLLDASLTEVNDSVTNIPGGASVVEHIPPPPKCSCFYNQALVDFTHRLLPDLASLSYQQRVDNFPILPLVNLAQRRVSPSSPSNLSDKTQYFHVPVPGCCQKDSYLTLGVELALMSLGQQRSLSTVASAHDRAVRQESELISKLEAIDTSGPLLLDILKHQTSILLEGGPFQNSCCGVSADLAPLHTYAKYLFESLVGHYPQMAYKVGVFALKMPLAFDENPESYGAARTSPRSISHSHLQNEQLALAQTMLSRAKDDSQHGGYLRKVYRASVKNIRNPASLLKLAKHVLKEAKPSGATLYPALLKTAFDLGLQVLKVTLTLHASSGKTRREAISFIVDCATDMGFESVLQVMKDARDYFSAVEALNLVVSRDSDHLNLRSQAINKFKLKENPALESQLNSRARDLALDCAGRDPTNCVLEALKFCETDDDALRRALKIVMEAGTNGSLDSTQLIKVADHVNERNMCDRAFEIALVAVNSLTIPSNSDNNSSKKDILAACEYAQKVNGFSTLIPKLINNIECATILSEIYHRFNPNTLLTSNYRGYSNEFMAHFGRNLTYNNDLLYSLNPEIYKQRLEDARWWDALLKRTLKAFVDTTRTRLQNISPRHYGEFIDFLVKAQGTFEKASDGPQQFKDLISEIIKSYRTKKKLMERLKARFDYSIKS